MTRKRNLKAAAEYSRNWRKANPTYSRDYKRSIRGLPEATRPAPDVCESCGMSPDAALHLDHCHVTGKFRGWLCNKCNLGIGALGDTVESLERAVAYLRRTA